MTTLYRKYRPQIFSDLTGQEHIVQTIKNEIALGKVAHAYLFSGPRGVGKTTLARLLAKAVNCQKHKDGESEPCNSCPACEQTSIGRYIDVIEIDAASHTGVDNVRENIIENAQFQPTMAKYKVFIIDEVHMLSGSAFNALLKTLEEPPAHVIFILATTELNKLPATVISRCQRFQFKKIPHDLMMARLKFLCDEEKVKVDKDVFNRIINKSDGALRDAESLLGQILSLNLKKITAEDAILILPSSSVGSVVEFVEHLAKKNVSAAFTLINQLVTDGVNLDQFAYDLLEMLRTVMIQQAAGQINTSTDYDDQTIKQLKKIAADISPASLLLLIDMSLRRRQELKTAPLPQLPLELLAVEWSNEVSVTNSVDRPVVKITTQKKELSDTNTAVASSPPLLSPPKADPPWADKEGSGGGLPLHASQPEPKPHSLAASIKSAISAITGKSTPATTLEQMKPKWEELIAKLTVISPSLTFILKMCTLTNIDHEGLHLTVPYVFHKERLEEMKNKHLIESVLQELCGEPIHVECTATPVAKTSPTESIDMVGLALEFGGEVVN